MKSTTNTRVLQNDIFKRLNSILGDISLCGLHNNFHFVTALFISRMQLKSCDVLTKSTKCKINRKFFFIMQRHHRNFLIWALVETN